MSGLTGLSRNLLRLLSVPQTLQGVTMVALVTIPSNNNGDFSDPHKQKLGPYQSRNPKAKTRKLRSQSQRVHVATWYILGP